MFPGISGALLWIHTAPELLLLLIAASLGELNTIGRSLALIMPCLELPSYSAHVPFFHISYYSLTTIVVSAPTSSFILAVSMREVYCVGYTPHAWDPRSLQSILDVPLYFGPLQRLRSY